jgi:hypothetical protein
MSCWDNPVAGLPFFSVWLVSSFITNLLLQKIVLMRADVLAKDGLPHCLRYVFYAEVCTAAILLCMTVFVTMTFAAMDISSFGEEGAMNTNSPSNVAVLVEMYNQLSPQDQRTPLARTFLVVAILTLTFVLFDLFFSIYSSLVMHRALRRVQEDAETNKLVIGQSTTPGARFTSNLERAVFFGKLNMALVVASVSTTTLFYASLIRFSLFSSYHVASMLPAAPGHFDVMFRSIYGTWLLDSLFNDACVLFVGFSPLEDALQTLATTRQFGASYAVPITEAKASEPSSLPTILGGDGEVVIGKLCNEAV